MRRRTKSSSSEGHLESPERSGRSAIRQALADHRTLLGALALVVLATGVIAMAAVFSSARSSVEVAGQGTRGIYDEAALSAAATTRNRALQAFLIDSAAAIGAAQDSELTAAIDAGSAGIGELQTRVTRLQSQITQPGQRQLIETATSNFVMSVNGLLTDLGSGAEVDSSDIAQIDDRYQDLAELLAGDRDVVVHQLELAQDDAGRIANAARFLVAFSIPLGLVIVFRRSVRRRQRQLELENELARQTEIAEHKDDFIADVSHELRTPLTSIYGFASTLLDEGVSSDPELTNEFATLIAMEADELSRMVDDLLTAARADDDALGFRREEVDPRAEVEAVLAPMRAVGIDVASNVASVPVKADRLRLRQVVRNLVSNANKHGEPPIVVVGRLTGLRYVLTVADNGPGVPPELENRLFERFIHQGREGLVTGSVGLGLSIAQLLARRMGGDLTYHRKNDVTTFVVELPLWVDLAAPETQEAIVTPD
ncbi:MAG: HAMP domain-containing sensor histidine kinase [Acidimicrobiia bacterium]